jgi:CheY-like chemotaxis protein
MPRKKMLGEILVNKGILSAVTVERMLALANRQKNRLGWFLEDKGLITEYELAEALAEQFDLKHVTNIEQYSYPKPLLELITPEIALEFHLFPLRREGENLMMAVADPTDMKMVNNIAKNLGVKISPVIVARKDIFAAICKHYLGKPASKPQKNTVLVADDDKMTREMLKEILVKNGFNVIVTADGMEAYKEIVANRPQVLLLDKEMPHLGGFELIKLIKSIHELKSIPTILISDKTTDDDEAKLFELGFFDFMSKPIKAVTLVSRVKRGMNVYLNSAEHSG